jgi:hypothetical protein
MSALHSGVIRFLGWASTHRATRGVVAAAMWTAVIYPFLDGLIIAVLCGVAFGVGSAITVPAPRPPEQRRLSCSVTRQAAASPRRPRRPAGRPVLRRARPRRHRRRCPLWRTGDDPPATSMNDDPGAGWWDLNRSRGCTGPWRTSSWSRRTAREPQ